MDDYVVGFRNLSFTTGLFCDSDDDEINIQKQAFVSQGIELIDSDSNNAIENQVFKDVSWATVKELIPIAIQKIMEDDGKSQEEAEESVFRSTNARLINKMASIENWYDMENNELRIALGETAKEKKWYKRQSYGERLGQIILKHYGELAERCKLKNEIDAISNWIDA